MVKKAEGISMDDEAMPDYDDTLNDADLSDDDFRSNVESILDRQQREADQASADNFELTSDQDGVDTDDDRVSDDTDSADDITKAELLSKMTDEQIRELCLDVERWLGDIDDNRTSNNDESKAVLSDAENRGLNKDAARIGHQFLKWHPKRQDNFLTSLVCYLKNNGFQVQGDMIFDLSGKDGSNS